MTTTTTQRLTCEAEQTFRDYDGSRASMPCGSPATWRTEIDDEQGSAYIANYIGGWDDFRNECIERDGEDPGEDPGRENWGRSTWLLCDDCHEGMVTAIATGIDYGTTLVADSRLSNLLIELDHDAAGPVYRVVTDDKHRGHLADFPTLTDAAEFVRLHKES